MTYSSLARLSNLVFIDWAVRLGGSPFSHIKSPIALKKVP